MSDNEQTQSDEGQREITGSSGLSKSTRSHRPTESGRENGAGLHSGRRKFIVSTALAASLSGCSGILGSNGPGGSSGTGGSGASGEVVNNAVPNSNISDVSVEVKETEVAGNVLAVSGVIELTGNDDIANLVTIRVDFYDSEDVKLQSLKHIFPDGLTAGQQAQFEVSYEEPSEVERYEIYAGTGPDAPRGTPT
ncbi:MAG: FxLYD domain-containing protein [Haloarculaceae archaeon]